ncbi:MATE family efflux transporter [Azohydromonas lata]|uniref:MATE family efflux transporter n=1 Tax=Azohydromonas lata TaxID=45677 RepID=UPI000AD84D88|nr:MATE family efflux transporter [Azohydromonas lata]
MPTLLRLALPNVLAMVMTVLVGIAETWYVGRLGTTPLAAMTLVFPFVMLTQMMSSGAMGGGVSSALSRALGASDALRAQAVAKHAVIVGAGAGLLYSLVFLLFGPALLHLLGGRGAVLHEAVDYATVMFGGALLLWLANTLASILRGTGDMRVPSGAIFGMAALQIVLGGVLGLGLGPLPSFGLVGIASGHVLATAAGATFLAWYLLSGRGRLTLHLRGIALQADMFFDILKVGAIACLSPLQSVLAVLIFTGLVARLGVLQLAGYGIGQRLEFLLMPIAFGIGVASVPMVGMAMGAGNVARARQVAWTAGGVSAFNLALIGAVVFLAPDLWAGAFSQDEAVLEHARQYLRIAGPAFPLFGLGLTLYFASQGAGRVLGPVLASTVRLVLVAGIGALLSANGSTASGFFWLVAAAMVAYGLSTAAAVKFTSWGNTH